MKTEISQLESEHSDREQPEQGIESPPQLETPNSKLQTASEPETRSAKPKTALAPENRTSELANPDPIGYGSITRKGKVARLPVSVREIVNRMIENGSRFQDIIERLDNLGHPGFQPPNISRWKSGGYLDWLALRERLACAKIRADSSRELIRDLENSDDLCHANEILMAADVQDTLLAPAPIPGTPEAEKRAKTLNIQTRTLATQMSERTRRDRIAFEKQRHQDKMQLAEKETIQNERHKRDLNEPLSHEETVSIVHKVDQLFGIKIKPPTEPTTSQNHKSPLTNYKLQIAELPDDGETINPLPLDNATASQPATQNTKHETPNSEHPSTEAPRPPFSAIFHNIAPPQPAPVNPQNEKLQVTNYQLEIAVPKPEASDNSKPAHQPSAIPYENEKLQLINYQLQIAVPTSKPAENPPNEDTPAETPQNPKHETQNSEQTRVPISPLAFPGSEIPHSALRTRKFNSQPQGTIPMFDVCGALVDWIPQSAPCPEIFDIVGFQNRRGKYVCWVHPNDPYRDPANPEPNPRRTAILNVNGLIIGWLTGHPDPAKPPSPTAQPINSRRFRHGLVAWIDERA